MCVELCGDGTPVPKRYKLPLVFDIFLADNDIEDDRVSNGNFQACSLTYTLWWRHTLRLF